MLLQRAKPAAAAQSQQAAGRREAPKFSEFLEARDYTGAMAVLEFQRCAGQSSELRELWLAYCAFHLGDYRRALGLYLNISSSNSSSSSSSTDLNASLACCYFMLGMHKEAEGAAQRAGGSQLRARVQLHLAHRLGNEAQLMGCHQLLLQDQVEDQLSLASVHFLRCHYQEAVDIYKRIMMDNRDYLALNVYVALCYHKMEYYEVSQELLAVYLQQFPDSVTAVNLKACNHFKLFNGAGAESVLLQLQEQASPNFSYAADLIKHNLVVFRGGAGALRVLPQLVDVLPEARLNLVIHHLRTGDTESAFSLMKDFDPSTPMEHILKAVVSAELGQQLGSREQLGIAQQYFQLVGGAASECDTVPGRQCMACCFFLLRQFDDVLVYLNSIRSFFTNDDAFNFNYAQAKAAVGQFQEAEEAFQLVQSDEIRQDFVFLSWLARCFIRNQKPGRAWEIYLQLEASRESFGLLQLIANDCYRMGQFYHAAKAFDMLRRIDDDPVHFEAKRGACAGVVQLVAAGREPPERLREVLQMLRSDCNSDMSELMISTIRSWANANQVKV